MIRFDKLTLQAPGSRPSARDIAARHDNQPGRALTLARRACRWQHDGIVPPLPSRLGVRPRNAGGREVRAAIGFLPKVTGVAQQQLSQASNKVPPKARAKSKRRAIQGRGSDTISAEHILLAIATIRKDPAVELLATHGASREAILQALTTDCAAATA